MKALAIILLSTFAPALAGAFTVHEWGTFTTVHAPDGTLLTGLEREEESLPNFVHCHAGFSPGNKGWSRPLANVTVKMETPVLYVYSEKSFRLNVAVDFIGGSISQWYPEKTSGETLPQGAIGQTADPVDFSRGFHGSAVWDVDVLEPGLAPKLAHEDWETPQWPRARVTSANTLRGPGNEEEGFIFYRGVGNFSIPLDITFGEHGELQLKNTGSEALPFVWIYDNRPDVGGRYAWSGQLLSGAKQIVTMAKVHFQPDRTRQLFEPLLKAGLTPDEANAMLATWRESYFDRVGLRVFWIVPRAFTDRVLPLRLNPVPDQLERVLIGRSEVITPGFAQELVRGFKADGGSQWRNDRHFPSYRALVERLGVAMTPAVPTLPAP